MDFYKFYAGYGIIYPQSKNNAFCVKLFYQIIISNISFANAMITPPKNVKNPFALCDASWDFSERPI